MSIKVPPGDNLPNPTVPGVPGALGWGPQPVSVWQEDPDTPGAWIDRSDRLLIARVHAGADDQAAGNAEGTYIFAEGAEPMRAAGVFQPDYLARAVDDLDPNLLIKVELLHPDGDGGRVLFIGYPGRWPPRC